MRTLVRTLLTTLTAALLGGCQSLMFQALKVPTLGQAFTHERVSYDAAHGLHADVYRPSPAVASSPTVVFLYGGSWRNGKRDWYRFAGASLAEAGLTVIIPDYRKVPEVHFPEFVEDAARAFAHVHNHIERYGGDRRRLFLLGHSAGAHIAALLCTDRRYLQATGLTPADVSGMIGLAGPYDFLPLTSSKVIEVFNGDPLNPQSQPVNFVDGDEPPMLLLHGRDDRLVWASNSQSLHGRMQAAGRDSQLRLYPDVGHVGIVLSLGRTLRHWSPALADTLHWIHQQSVRNTASH